MTEIKTTLSVRTYIKGKFLYCGAKKLFIKGVTYGTFMPLDGNQFPPQEVIHNDFKMMRDSGVNCVRTYTIPPVYLLDIAYKYELKVMVGLPWEQHITFLDGHRAGIIARVGRAVRDCEKHPAILCFAIGNEIPAPLVRWYGKKKVESFLKQLYRTVKQEDPGCLVTYVNYPTTEYLDLSFLDFDCFNVYLETPAKLSSYILRLHNLCGERPLVLAEIGLDSLRNGVDRQAEVMRWQIETVFGNGCAGMFVFSWTDEWWRGGSEIEDWDFGLVDRQRRPKPALAAVADAMQHLPFSGFENMPSFSVVVCTYNGAHTIRDTLNGLLTLDYADYEVIVINDGSTDQTAAIVGAFPVKLITTKNKGLGSARNTGMHHATNEIIAYIDDDAYPDPHWLKYLAHVYLKSQHSAVGGPNIIPPEDGPIATCVANAPGGPVHVLISDDLAEHIPGCNLSVKRSVLMEIGGFDPIYRSAGDDVDVCWRIQKAGYTIGFHPSALVWHHRRNSLKAYWKQQQGYGKAEALLEGKWPEKYNAFGHLTWGGRIYGNGFTIPIKTKKAKVFHGSWGSALFQSVYEPAEGFFKSIPLMPEWYLLSLFFAITGSVGFIWPPLLLLWLLFFASLLISVVQAIVSAKTNTSLTPQQRKNYKYFLLIVWLHLVQPLARLKGRIRYGLTPWRMNAVGANIQKLTVLKPKVLLHWSENNWRSSDTWLETVEQNVIALKASVRRGGDFDRWDIKVKNGIFSTAQGLLTIEEHGSNKQYVKLKYQCNYSRTGIAIILGIGAVALMAFWDRNSIAGLLFAGLMFGLLGKYILDCASVVNCLVTAFNKLDTPVALGDTLALNAIVEDLPGNAIAEGIPSNGYDARQELAGNFEREPNLRVP